MIRIGSDQEVVREQMQGAKIGEVIWKREALRERLLSIYEK